MTPEELQKLDDIKSLLIEIKAVLDRSSNAKEQHWKDEQARRRERCW